VTKMELPLLIAIDGPAGSGKSTVAKILARRLGFRYLDTGAMYRCVALLALRAGIALDDDEAVGRLAKSAEIEFSVLSPEGRNTGAILSQQVLLDGEDVTALIRTAAVDDAVSQVSKLPSVRTAMLAKQKVFGESGESLVAEGRDTGTVIFPDAKLKVYLTASASERAKRRYTEFTGRGEQVSSAAVSESMNARDEADATRQVGPLTIASDAHVIDTTGVSIDEVVDRIVALAKA